MRRAEANDAALLAELGASSFTDTFAAANHPDDFSEYMASAFGERIQRQELETADTTVFFADRAGEAVGYLMLREGEPPLMVDSREALQIVRLYARQSALGTGVGAALMQRAIDEATRRGKDAVWLGVWERNDRALEFYRRWGFVEAGTQPFMLGTDLQTDFVMVRRIVQES